MPPINPSSRRQKDEGQGWDGVNSAWIIVSHLLTGILLYGFLGWVLSLWIGHRPLLMAGGAMIGMFLAIYLIYRRLEAGTPEPKKTRKGAGVTHSEVRHGR